MTQSFATDRCLCG